LAQESKDSREKYEIWRGCQLATTRGFERVFGGKKFSPLFPNSNSYEKQVGQQSP
jgi:hypothetical protein